MGNSWPKLKELTAIELYNKLQDTRELILVVDATLEDCGDVNEEVISKRRARGWTVVVMGDDNKTRCARDLQHWIYKHGFGSCDDSSDLVKDVCELEGGVDGFYSLFPWLSPQHAYFEAGRLYPSLIFRDGSSLFLSNFGVASDPYIYRALDIKYVVNCSRDLPFVDEVVSILRERNAKMVHSTAFPPINTDHADHVDLKARLRVPVDDSCDYQICEYFAESVNFISDCMSKQDGHILIHCKHGQSRSATIAAAFLLIESRKRSPTSLQEVLSKLKSCRPRVSPNEGFLKQLHSFEGAIS